MSELDYAPPPPSNQGEINNLVQAINHLNGLPRREGWRRVYRGQASSKWNVVAGLFRDDMQIMDSESKMVRDIESRFPSEFSTDLTMFDRLVRLQHYGLRTRLMDVSKNPLAALFFAVSEEDHDDKDAALVVFDVPDDRVKYFDSDSVSCVSNLANLTSDEKETVVTTTAKSIPDFMRIHAADRLLQFVRVEKPYFRPRIKREDLFKPFYVIPKLSNQRILAQSGSFLIFGLSMRRGPSYRKGIGSFRYIIPANSKASLRDSLINIGFDSATMFPEIDKFPQVVMKGYDHLL